MSLFEVHNAKTPSMALLSHAILCAMQALIKCYLHVNTMAHQWYPCWCILQLVPDVVFSVAVEAVVPQCAIIQLVDGQANWNSLTFAGLRDGSIYDGQGRGKVRGGTLHAGSRAEGLAMEAQWGHPLPDEDNMILYGSPLGVHVPQGHRPPGRSVLRYRPEGCPPAYCKIEVTDVQTLVGVDEGWDFDQLGASCVHKTDGMDWLHTHNTLRRIQFDCGSISGPVGQWAGGFYECAITLVCSDAHPDIYQNYMHRPRHGWPSSQQLELIRQFPMLLVLTGHKLSHKDEIPLQARLSWSPAEIVLIKELPESIKQVYIAVKFTFKHLKKTLQDRNRAGDGRSNVGSFHLKMVFLYHLERNPPTVVRSQLKLMRGLLFDLDRYLDAGKLPHYFMPDCNLLATVGPEERRIARNIVGHILSNPVRAILMCPTCPPDIYGEVPPDDLVAAFHQVSCHPTCVNNRERLLQILSCLDDTRRKQYQQQLWRDKNYTVVIDRVELKGLAYMLQRHVKWIIV